MALVTSPSSLSSTPRDPTAALQVALTNFENVLTAEQRQQFKLQIQGFNQQKPDASSVIQIVAEIDAVNHARIQRSVSPRLCTFLDATRQFTNVVDTFVSSNPAIAALVWSGIKTTILIASNVTSYFEKVATMLMIIGQMCPIYREFAYLYSDSSALQQSLCEYYSIVVRLVTRIVQVSQRTAVNHILLSVVSPFESEFGPFQNELAEASRVVKLQVSLAAKQAAQASARLVEFESRENRQYRRFARRFASEVRTEHDAAQQIRIQESARRATKMKRSIKDQLSTINQQISWRQAQKQRLAGTAEWFRCEQDFKAWETDLSTATLWCPGRMGAGKTVLVSNIIAYLHTSMQASDVISFHFCRSENLASLSARNILGTLARQILNKHIEDAHGDQLQSLLDACQDMNTEDIVELVLPRLDTAKNYYIIVDGLDECDPGQIAELAKSMNRICNYSGPKIKALYSGRPELEHQLFQRTKPNYRLSLSRSMVKSDIECYIDTELDDSLEKQKLKLVNPETIWKIRDTLVAEHDGLLLFVRLFIEEICMLGNENAILEALGNPPKKISDLLATRVRRVRGHSLAMDALNILRYCGCTRRPLTVNEFSELLSISVSQTSLDRTKIRQNMDQIITACYGLIYVEEEEETIHYVHHSVKHHLFIDSNSQTEDFIESDVDISLGQLCLTYLSFNDFQRQVQKINAISNTPVAPIEIGLAAVQNHNSTINEIARKLLKARRSSRLTTAELSRRTGDILGKVESSRLTAELQSRPFYLLDYAQSHWIWHSSRFTEDTEMWHRFLAFVRGGNDLARRPWIRDSDLQQRSQVESASSTAWALIHDHAALLLHEILRDPCVLSVSERVDILEHAIITENHQLALIRRSDQHHHVDFVLRGLQLAAYHGRTSFVDLFLKAGAEIDGDPAGEGGWTALQFAADRGHLEVVERLLAIGADVNIVAGFSGRTALQAAADRGHLEVVDRLLDAGARTDAVTIYDGRMALHYAAGRGHTKVIERLLVAGADVNATTIGTQRQTALQAAAAGGHIEVVERLLAAGAVVNAEAASNRQSHTALQSAAAGGHIEVVERLLGAGADVNATVVVGFERRTALQAAAGKGHLEIVRQLLAAGANDNAFIAAEPVGKSALRVATEEGHLEVEKLLRSAGAE